MTIIEFLFYKLYRQLLLLLLWTEFHFLFIIHVRKKVKCKTGKTEENLMHLAQQIKDISR